MKPLKPNASFAEIQEWIAESQANTVKFAEPSAPTPQERRQFLHDQNIQSMKAVTESFAEMIAANQQRAERQKFIEAFTGKPEKSPNEQLADYQKQTRDALQRKLLGQ